MKTFIHRSCTLALLALFMICITLPHACAAPETWTLTGSMSSGRVLHTATLLANGKVLVAGGRDNSGGILSTAEVYDPATGLWTSTGSMQSKRHLHTATLLDNGKVVVAGGVDNNGTQLASAEVYDPATGIWTNTGSMNSKRASCTVTLLPNGKVLVTGGEVLVAGGGSDLSTAELYDPMTEKWTSTGSMGIARKNHTATLLPNGKVLVAGGSTSGHPWLSSAELYDPFTGIWTNTGSMNSVRVWHTATLLPNGKVLVAAGHNGVSGIVSSAELYDPATGGWIGTGIMQSKRWFHSSTLLGNGKVLVEGGGELSNTSAELYDSVTGIWSGTGAMNNGRNTFEAVLLANGKVMAAGGNDNGIPLSSAELYEPGVTITLEGATHGTITGNASPYSINTNATLAATPTPGYLFTGWTGDATGTDNPLAVLMISDKTISATFSPDTNDTDGDGLTNYHEIVEYGTDPALWDTDGDGVKDSKDAFPLDINEWLDTDLDGTGDNADLDDDGDGLSDEDEINIYGSNPKRADSDGDGLSDPDELQIHLTNPNLADTDDDGLSDGAEVNTCGTLPLVADTDGDGFLDGYEVLTGKSPTNINDKPALVAEARTAIEFTFPSALGKTYRIEDSLNLDTWGTVESGIAGNGAVVQRFYTTRNVPKRYFRVEEDNP